MLNYSVAELRLTYNHYLKCLQQSVISIPNCLELVSSIMPVSPRRIAHSTNRPTSYTLG